MAWYRWETCSGPINTDAFYWMVHRWHLPNERKGSTNALSPGKATHVFPECLIVRHWKFSRRKVCKTFCKQQGVLLLHSATRSKVTLHTVYGYRYPFSPWPFAYGVLQWNGGQPPIHDGPRRNGQILRTNIWGSYRKSLVVTDLIHQNFCRHFCAWGSKLHCALQNERVRLRSANKNDSGRVTLVLRQNPWKRLQHK